MELNNAIVHQLIKETGTRGAEAVEIILREIELDITNENIISLTEQIKDTYTKKNGLGYGDFEEETGLFEQKLTALNSEEINFIEFSRSTMTQLKNSIKNETLATGGYILFYKYEEQQRTYLIIAMLKNKGSFNFDENLDLIDVSILDLDHLHIAARLNFQKWQVNEEHYVSFVKGRSQDITSYFKSFLGINDENYTDSKENTGDLYSVTLAYCEEKKYSMESENSVRQHLFDLCMNKHSSGESLTLQEVANIVAPEEPESFITFANTEDHNLPGEIYVDKRVVRRLVNISGGDNMVRVSFTTEALDNNRVQFDLENNFITITGIPGSVRNQLREYDDDNEE